jgi:Abortive infection bacteriophage resistance protein
MNTGPLSPPKAYKSYDELIELLRDRGMHIEDSERAKRKLAQVGYYRLSGFSYPCRTIKRDTHGNVVKCPVLKVPSRLNTFQDGTSFNSVFNLYLFDKRLRLLMMDALERIEIYIRAIIAHEIGKGYRKKPGSGELIPDPMAWMESDYVNPKHLKPRPHPRKSDWDQWLDVHNTKIIGRSKEECIQWHRSNSKSMPFWVVIEAWDFGTMSKYYGMLKQKFAERVCARLGLHDLNAHKTLAQWLRAMNILRNRCAHHSRIWNQHNTMTLPVLNNDYFNSINLDHNSKERLFGIIAVMNYLLEKIGPSSTWMNDVIRETESFPQELPGCNLNSLGVPATGIPTYFNRV